MFCKKKICKTLSLIRQNPEKKFEYVIIDDNICDGYTMCVCLYVYSNKKSSQPIWKKSFFPRKVWTQGVTLAILEVSNTTPSCKKPDKPSKNGVFRTSDMVLRRFTASFRQKWTQRVPWAIIESSNTTPSCRKPDKPSKTVFFGLPRQIAWFRRKFGTIVHKTCPLLNIITRSGAERSEAKRSEA